jgi:hypothetical protein
MNTKLLKIPEGVHRELKVFVAKNGDENMADIAGIAIMKELKERGHKFVLPATKKKKC